MMDYSDLAPRCSRTLGDSPLRTPTSPGRGPHAGEPRQARAQRLWPLRGSASQRWCLLSANINAGLGQTILPQTILSYGMSLQSVSMGRVSDSKSTFARCDDGGAPATTNDHPSNLRRLPTHALFVLSRSNAVRFNLWTSTKCWKSCGLSG